MAQSKVVDLSEHVRALRAEKARLTTRQIEIDELLSGDGGDADLDALRDLARERGINADLFPVVERRLGVACEALHAEQKAERDRAARALRPAERKQFLAVVKAADVLWEAIQTIEQGAYADLGALGVAPLTWIPRELYQMLKPGPNGARHYWARSLEQIDAAVK